MLSVWSSPGTTSFIWLCSIVDYNFSFRFRLVLWKSGSIVGPGEARYCRRSLRGLSILPLWCCRILLALSRSSRSFSFISLVFVGEILSTLNAYFSWLGSLTPRPYYLLRLCWSLVCCLRNGLVFLLSFSGLLPDMRPYKLYYNFFWISILSWWMVGSFDKRRYRVFFCLSWEAIGVGVSFEWTLAFARSSSAPKESISSSIPGVFLLIVLYLIEWKMKMERAI